jgi:hypothetical protein
MSKREDILARLVVVCSGIEGVVLCARNRDEISDRQKPAIIIMDADEAAIEGEPKRPGPQIISMTPEIYILLSGEPATVGTELNAMRAALLSAVLNDATLRTITGPNGAIRYEGCATGLSRGRSMEGEMGVSLSFQYPFNPNNL